MMCEDENQKQFHSVRAVSRMTGVSIRTLHYYDEIGLLRPARLTESGYRLYDEDGLKRLQCILIYRELGFTLREINDIMSRSGSELDHALERQITLLKMKRKHIDNLIALAEGIIETGVSELDLSGFDLQQIDDYEDQAKKTWGGTSEFREYEEKAADRSVGDKRVLAAGLMNIFVCFGKMLECDPSDDAVQEKVKALRDYISDHYYTCSNEILLSLGRMYSGDERFRRNIDKAGGDGTAEFVTRAIEIYCASAA